MNKILITLGTILLLIVIGGFVFREEIFFMMMASGISPDHSFDEKPAPEAPDYDDPAWWAASPQAEDPSDQMPAGVTPAPTGVGVFFVHPTSYFGKEHWNQPLQHESANWIVDERILRHQASVFNSCCEVYAPRYRQATFFSFMDQDGNGEKALDLAYADVVDAFNHFISELEADQPFVLAGHSQGSRHATQLLREHIDGTPLQARLVAAYLVGFGVTDDQLGSVPVCANATQTGCALGWNAMDGEGAGAFGGNEGLICTNPLNWAADESYAGHDLNLGAIGYPNYTGPVEGEDITAMNVEVGIADAQCMADGQLAVLELKSEAFPGRMFGNSMHPYDYSLYHANVRENVAARIAAFTTAP